MLSMVFCGWYDSNTRNFHFLVFYIECFKLKVIRHSRRNIRECLVTEVLVFISTIIEQED